MPDPLTTAREQAGLSVHQAVGALRARGYGAGARALRAWENGLVDPPADAVGHLAVIYGTSPAALAAGRALVTPVMAADRLLDEALLSLARAHANRSTVSLPV